MLTLGRYQQFGVIDMDLPDERTIIICYNDTDNLDKWLAERVQSKYTVNIRYKYGKLYSYTEAVHNPFTNGDISFPQRLFYVKLTGWDGTTSLKGGEGVFGAAGIQAQGLYLVDGSMTPLELNYLQARLRVKL